MALRGTGATTLTFAAAPQAGAPVVGSNSATSTITGLTDMTAAGSASALLMASDSSADHNDAEHGMVDMTLRCADFVAGVGFTIHASSPQRLDGAFTVRYAWSA